MALRDRLIAEKREHVLARTEGSEAAEGETLETVLAHLPEGFTRDGPRITRPDGEVVDLFGDTPLAVAGRLVQEDLCLLERPEGGYEHLLSAAILCFPASWTLAEKIGRPLGAIHGPVPDYDPDMAARVQRMFDAIRPGTPALAAERAALCQPRPAPARIRGRPARGGASRHALPALRTAMPPAPAARPGAIVFSIHTYVLPVTALSPSSARALRSFPSTTRAMGARAGP
jgi:hypothetical protein